MLSGKTPTPIMKASKSSRTPKTPTPSLKKMKMKQDKLIAKYLSDGMKNCLKMKNTESISVESVSQMKSNGTVVLRPEYDMRRNNIVRMDNNSDEEYCTGGQGSREEGYTGGGEDNTVIPCTGDADLTLL